MLLRLRHKRMQTSSHPKPKRVLNSSSYRPQPFRREEGTCFLDSQPQSGVGEGDNVPKPTRPDPKKIALAVAPIMRGASSQRVNTLETIAKLAGTRPELWEKPKFGDFEYWLAHNCGWISDEELRQDTSTYQAKKQLALQTSHRFAMNRFTWDEQPRFEAPEEGGGYAPEVSMKLIKDRNLTDSSRRIAMFIMRHAYHDNREGRFIGMTVSFMMKGLAISRRTVQRSLTLLETRGYFRCEVAKGDATKMCIGLIVHLLSPLFPKHHQKKWPEKRRNPEASRMPHKQKQFYKTIYNSPNKVLRMNWALRCMYGVFRIASKTSPFSICTPSLEHDSALYCPNLLTERHC